MGETFIADIHCDQRVWTEPRESPCRGRRQGVRLGKQQASGRRHDSGEAGRGFARIYWTRCVLRDSTRVHCGSMSRIGGSGCGTVRKRRCGIGPHRAPRGGAPTRSVQPVQRPDTPPECLAEMQESAPGSERAFEDGRRCGSAYCKTAFALAVFEGTLDPGALSLHLGQALRRSVGRGVGQAVLDSSSALPPRGARSGANAAPSLPHRPTPRPADARHRPAVDARAVAQDAAGPVIRAEPRDQLLHCHVTDGCLLLA